MLINSYIPESYTHPGATLKEKLDEIKMSIKEFALRISKPEKTIHEILNFESSITPDMAVQFEKVLKIPAKFWINYQANYNEIKAINSYKEMLSYHIEWAKSFPYNEMVKKGWVLKTRNNIEKVENLLNFFGFSSPNSWERYYFNSELKTAFRISLKQVNEHHAISAWLRYGEIEAEKIHVQEYNENLFKQKLNEIKYIVKENPDNFFIKLKKLCSEAGVKVIFSPCLAKSPINGCTRWFNNSPVIQLSDRYKKNDRFWFTFYHEAGHVLLHGKKEIFLEGFEGNLIKEKEADDFAANFLLN
jgi:addiction module HigA family antidote